MPSRTSHQSPVTSHQSPVTSHQSPVTSHQSPVTERVLLEAGCWKRVSAPPKAIGDGKPPILAKRLSRDPHTRCCLSALVLVAIDHRGDPCHHLAVEPVTNDLIDGPFLLDITLEDRVKDRVGRK